MKRYTRAQERHFRMQLALLYILRGTFGKVDARRTVGSCANH